MLYRLGLFFLGLLICGQVSAIDAVVQHTVFYQTAKQQKDSFFPFAEICWQINPNSIRYKTNADKNIISEIKVDIVFNNDAGVIAQDHFIMQTSPRKNVEALASLNIMEQKRYVLPSGMVRMQFTLTDVQDVSNKFVLTDSFLIEPAANTPFYSELQLVDTVLKSELKSPFQRDGLLKLPIATNFIDEHIRSLHYYTELYNSSKIDSKSLIQKISISKQENDFPSGRFLKTDTIKPQSTMQVYGEMPIGYLGSGNYYLNIALEDMAGATLASKSLFFQRFNKHPLVEEVKALPAIADTGVENVRVLDLSKTFLQKYTTAQLRAILKMLLPIADPVGTQSIQSFLKKPNDMYMRYFIYNFFQNVNRADPAKAWKEYSDKVLNANKRFTANGVAGYETSRGFMFLRYGEPTEIITISNESGALPYEVWQYNELKQSNRKMIANAVFLFYKPNRPIVDYELLHSNVTGEISNPRWRTFLYVGEQAGSSGNSMAEQYIGNK
jgi:GWxTD domain-containing protein